MNSREVLKYAQLAQQAYNDDTTLNLPLNWRRIYYRSPEGEYDNCYSIYVNEKEKEVVLAIRGSELAYNFLADAGLVVGAINGRRKMPPDQQALERRAKEFHKNLNYKFRDENNGEIFDLDKLGNSIRGMDDRFGPETVKFIGAASFISAATTGVVAPATIGKVSTSLSTSGYIKNENVDLLDISKKVRERTIESIKETQMLDIETLILKPLRDHNKSDFKFKIVGHSLGGLMAELCAVANNVPCISFESPGSLEIIQACTERYKDKYEQNKHLLNTYLSAPNIVNTLDSHPGSVFRLFLKHTEDKFTWKHFGRSALHGTALIATAIASVWTGGAAVGVGIGVGALLGADLLGGALGLWADFEWFKRQHSIDGNSCVPPTNEPKNTTYEVLALFLFNFNI